MSRRRRWYDGWTSDAERDARADEREDEMSARLSYEQEAIERPQAPRWEQEDGVSWIIGGGDATDKMDKQE